MYSCLFTTDIFDAFWFPRQFLDFFLHHPFFAWIRSILLETILIPWLCWNETHEDKPSSKLSVVSKVQRIHSKLAIASVFSNGKEKRFLSALKFKQLCGFISTIYVNGNSRQISKNTFYLFLILLGLFAEDDDRNNTLRFLIKHEFPMRANAVNRPKVFYKYKSKRFPKRLPLFWRWKKNFWRNSVKI